MVIKVIKEEPDPTVLKTRVCQNCGVTLQYTPADVQENICRDYGGGSDTYYYIICPRCSAQQNVNILV